MKKILLASTILVGSAGVAAADNANFSFSGSAFFGVGYETAGGTFAPEIDSSFTVGMMSTTDHGLEFGATITVGAPGVTWEDDHTDTAFGTFSENGMSVSDSSVYMSGDWGKLAVAYDADGSGAGATTTDWDVVATYSNTWGDFGVSAYYTFAVDGAAGTNGDLGVKGTYSFGDYSVYAKYDWDNSVTDWRVGLGGSATMSGFTVSVDAEYTNNPPSDWDWKAAADYTTGAYTIGAFVEDDGTDDLIDWGLNGSYDLGGGMSVDAAVIRDQDTTNTLVKAGVSMAF
ncbi:porin [Sinisalibacter lacisalsi]|uniref:Porin n=1 Tax=Sinisalibacter lacisalsi TaxID=1526570 RepID=A0ABQ1QAL4_9RHOB|nr:porin [Sinisalibacter lacisalsi]GGD19855.1 porin [Sinisalibacter lacisalsi]